MDDIHSVSQCGHVSHGSQELRAHSVKVYCEKDGKGVSLFPVDPQSGDVVLTQRRSRRWRCRSRRELAGSAAGWRKEVELQLGGRICDTSND